MPTDPRAAGIASDGSFSIGSNVWPGVSKLIEEMGELHQVLGKLIATHGASDHWDGTDLRQRLIEEMGDVAGALIFVQEVNALDGDAIAERAERKADLFRQWQEAQS